MEYSCDDLKDVRGDSIMEFIGPVKIILVDQPKGLYWAKICKGSGVLMAQILLGASAMPVLWHTLSYNKEDIFKALHIFLCTVGLQLLLPFGILSLNRSSGSSVAMLLRHRRLEHMVLQFLGTGCAVAGTVVAILLGYTDYHTIHTYLGLAAVGIVLTTFLFGVLFSRFRLGMYLDDVSIRTRGLYNIHRFLGVVSFITSSACYVSGMMYIITKAELFYIFILVCVFYTFVIILQPLKSLFI